MPTPSLIHHLYMPLICPTLDTPLFPLINFLFLLRGEVSSVAYHAMGSNAMDAITQIYFKYF